MIHPVDPLYQIVWSTRPLLAQIEAAVEANLPNGMTVRMRATLEALQDGPATVPNIARRLYIKRQYVQLMVNEAIKDGFAEARANPAHTKSKLIFLTKNGEKTISAIRAKEITHLGAIGHDLSSNEIEAAQKVVMTLLAGFTALNESREK